MIVKYLLILFLIAGCAEKTESVIKEESFSSCSNTPKMTNSEIIKETKFCDDSGLDAEGIMCGDDPLIIQIQCKPR